MSSKKKGNNSLYCNVCDKTYKTQKTFDIHIKKSFNHLNINPYTCIYCNKTFSSKACITYHNNICKTKDVIIVEKTAEEKITDMELIITNLTINLNEYKEMLNQKDNKYKEILTQKDNIITLLQDENVSLKMSIKEKQVALDITKECMKEMKPTINNNNNIYNNKTFIQNIGNSLVPICDDEIRETVDKLGIQHFKQGPKGVVKFVTIDYLAPRVVCTDLSRHTTVWKDENKEIIHDTGSKRLSEKVSSIIGEKDYTPMLDAFDASIDQTNPEDLIDMNTAFDSVLQFKNKRQTALDELARGISKGVKTSKQLTESKNCFLNLQKSLKEFVDKNIKDVVLGGIEGVFLTFIKHFQQTEDTDIEIFTEIDKVKDREYMWFSSKESSATYLLDDSGELVTDKHHELLIIEICKFLFSIRKCSPFSISNNELKQYLENSSELCELYQECI